MTTSLAAPKAETYAAPGRYYTASPGTSRTILKNFTAPMTPRYYGVVLVVLDHTVEVNGQL